MDLGKSLVADSRDQLVSLIAQLPQCLNEMNAFHPVSE
ncbi:hypothetical protein SAMN05414139_10071 [Burkholderia sp. D7]|jgi:hypothetical protein|nr:hypothetical protein SAMN05414139_10071 [Burkholderia sp. D7]